MTTHKHTPGPWKITTYCGPKYMIGIDKECASPGEMEANARLIAAAPDLLEAAKGALKHMTHYCPEETSERGYTIEPSVKCAKCELITAIDLATNGREVSNHG